MAVMIASVEEPELLLQSPDTPECHVLRNGHSNEFRRLFLTCDVFACGLVRSLCNMYSSLKVFWKNTGFLSNFNDTHAAENTGYQVLRDVFV